MSQTAGALGHSPCGECGLKSERKSAKLAEWRHSPCGECGLKFAGRAAVVRRSWSLPMRGVWIEMLKHSAGRNAAKVTPHAGSVD